MATRLSLTVKETRGFPSPPCGEFGFDFIKNSKYIKKDQQK
jgi:hypothetical protein